MAAEDGLYKSSKQLDAIVRTTGTATHDILIAVEDIEKVLPESMDSAPNNEVIASAANDIGGLVVKMSEACSFRDVTGQRGTKVIKTINYIEGCVLSVIDIRGIEAIDDFAIAEQDHDEEHACSKSRGSKTRASPRPTSTRCLPDRSVGLPTKKLPRASRPR